MWDKDTKIVYKYVDGEIKEVETDFPVCPKCKEGFGVTAFRYNYCPMCGYKVKS